ncbi:hypothetical protein C8J56DRAFT_473881 [Mycena floridula]|nr:hypothetical protein C8J56DRAFT_473881 [Mycena floridula]
MSRLGTADVARASGVVILKLASLTLRGTEAVFYGIRRDSWGYMRWVFCPVLWLVFAVVHPHSISAASFADRNSRSQRHTDPLATYLLPREASSILSTRGLGLAIKIRWLQLQSYRITLRRISLCCRGRLLLALLPFLATFPRQLEMTPEGRTSDAVGPDAVLQFGPLIF